WTTTAGVGPNDVFVSHDDGATFSATHLASATGRWLSIRGAPGDPLRVYVAGTDVGGGMAPAPILARSDDGGATWIMVPFTFMNASQVWILGVSPIDPD